MGNLQTFRLVFLCWLTCTTIGLPLTIALIFCKRFRSRWFVWFYVHVIGEDQKKTTAEPRRKAFRLLSDNLPKRPKGSNFQVLEIGAGEALNLQHYPEDCEVTFLDTNDHFRSYLEENAQKYPQQVKSWKTIIQSAEDMGGLGNDSFDIVVSTYVHCSCRHSQAVLREVKRVLKPGGKYLFLDHVGYPKNDFGYIAQQLLYPLWYLYFDGCHNHKDVEEEIRKSPFIEVECQKIVLPDGFIIKHQVMGLAVK